MNIGLQPRNHGFVGQSESLLFICPAAHDKGFAAADLVIHDAAAQENIHPYCVLLAGIEVFDTQRLTVEARKGQVRAVVFWPHVTVELSVVGICQTLLKLFGLVAQPLGETAADLVDFRIRKLHFLAVIDFDFISVLVVPCLGDVRRSIMQRMFHQVQPRVFAELSTYRILVLYFDVELIFGLYGKLVQIGEVSYLYLRIEKP